MPFVTRRGTVAVPGGRIAYTDRGDASAPAFVLIHGLLLSQRMHERGAAWLAERGHRVITPDLLGHGASSRPADMTVYSIRQFAGQVVALLDHLGLATAAVGGTSLGANVALETAVRDPERVRAMVVEMPVLDNALPAAAWTFVPIMTLCTFAEPAARMVSRGARAVPSRLLPYWVDVAADVLRQEPRPSGAVLQGLLYGQAAPHRDERRALRQPALVIGHRRDPLHPFSDSGALAKELRNARLVEASSILELRLNPERLLGVIAEFLDATAAGRGRSRRRAWTATAARRAG
ncbi:MAG TPA: alpha/beta fold hydrolase [Candidatus Dormibacteraeota bacterium]|nr:alpha/beta fold hydrolase [Candidatus Dormibacteraeota bacterium]